MFPIRLFRNNLVYSVGMDCCAPLRVTPKLAVATEKQSASLISKPRAIAVVQVPESWVVRQTAC